MRDISQCSFDSFRPPPPFLRIPSSQTRVLFLLLLWDWFSPSLAIPTPNSIPQQSSPRNTMDALQEQPLVSIAFIDEQNRKCGVERLCNAVERSDLTPICGTDGRTYNSPCELRRANCLGNRVNIKFRNPCPQNSKCRLEREFQQAERERKNTTSLFIPDCQPDGAYASVQCHEFSGYCWCVTSTGRPIPSTAVHNKVPDCVPQGCSSADRSTFNNNIIKIFRAEYDRTPNKKRITIRGKSAVLESMKKTVMDWKFKSLDRNHNNRISRKEIRQFKRMVKNHVQPRACARRFSRTCDFNSDNKISRKEWFGCLGVDIHIPFRFFSLLTHTNQTEPKRGGRMPKPRRPLTSDSKTISGRRGSGKRGNLKAQNDGISRMRPGLVQSVAGSPDAVLAAYPGSNDGGVLGPSRSVSSGHKTHQTGSQDDVSIEATPKNCTAQRLKVERDIENKHDKSEAIFVPDCDGAKWMPVQCHTASQNCWCVETDTGEFIPYSGVRFKTPKCGNTTSHKKETVMKFPKCEGKKRQKFFARLYSTLESSMIASGGVGGMGEGSLKELSLQWKFDQLDRNKNNRLERREWKPYRRELRRWKGVRTCGRNFLNKFCDSDSNKKITKKEWLTCAFKADSERSSTGRNPSVKGRNPFVGILDPNQ